LLGGQIRPFLPIKAITEWPNKTDRYKRDRPTRVTCVIHSKLQSGWFQSPIDVSIAKLSPSNLFCNDCGTM